CFIRRTLLTSERQMAANRANALRSTGPKTAKGKAAIRLNALRHGLLARDVVLPEEDADAFEELRNQVRASLSPIGPIEEFLIDQIVNAMWRLRRLAQAEALLFHSRMHAVKADRISSEMRSYEKAALPGLLVTVITDETAHTEASEALRCATYERDRDEVLLGRAIAADAATRGAWNGLCSVLLRSSASCRTGAKAVLHLRFLMPLRWRRVRQHNGPWEAYQRPRSEEIHRKPGCAAEMLFFCETKPFG